MAVTIQQAAANALAAHLSARLTGVAVDHRWPDSERPLPEKAVTILLAGKPDDTYLQPAHLETLPGSDPQHVVCRWLVLERVQPLQIDVWARYDVARDDLLAALEPLLNAGGLPYEPAAGNGLLLALGDGWSGKADFSFDGPSLQQSPSSVQQGEWRAIINGEARCAVYVDAESPKLAQIKLQQILNGAAMNTTVS